jgi:hypothetical protein
MPGIRREILFIFYLEFRLENSLNLSLDDCCCGAANERKHLKTVNLKNSRHVWLHFSLFLDRAERLGHTALHHAQQPQVDVL